MGAYDPVRNDASPNQAAFLAGLLLMSAVLFNAVLAIVNARVTPLSPPLVIASEVLIVAGAHLVALTHFRARMAPWYALIGIFVLFALFRSFALGEPEVKYLRDVILIPSFIVLGMTFPRRRLTQLLVALQLVVLAGLTLELAAPDAYSALFSIKSYYINTRGYTEADFWNTGSDLFVSASRPDERFFSFVDLHRMSSVFLEPVSLGNYCIIVVCYVFAAYREMTLFQRIVLIGGTMVLIVGCDGRLAAIACIIIWAASLFAMRLPSRFVVILPPLIFAAALAAVSIFGFKAGSDDFPGRLAHTVELLRHYGVSEFLGVSDIYLSRAVDSGLAYLITTQSLLLVALIWLCIALITEERGRGQIVFKIGVALYIALSMLVSFSFLSIKTAAILWFVLGSMQEGPLRFPAPTWKSRRPLIAPATLGGDAHLV